MGGDLTLIAEALTISGACFRGISQTTAKRGVQELSPSVFLATKWAASGTIFSLVMLATGAWAEFRWNQGTIAILAASIVGPVIAWSMYTRALLLVDVAVAVTVSELNLLWGMLLAIVLLGERPNPAIGVGALAIMVGAVLVQAGRRNSGFRVLGPGSDQQPETRNSELETRNSLQRGALLALGASFAWGINLFLFKVAADNLTPVQANWTRTAIPGFIWAFAFLYRQRSRRRRGLPRLPLSRTGLAYAVATGLLADLLDWTFLFIALGMAPASTVIPLTGTEPLFAALFARFALGETLQRRQVMGIGLVVAGVALIAGLSFPT